MILFDAHVHIYDNFNLDLLIEAAFANFCSAIKDLGGEEKDCSCFLLLTESGELNYFSSLRDKSSIDRDSFAPRWTLEETKESCSLRVIHSDYSDISLFIVAGRQLITSERLELLALLTAEQFPDNMSLDVAVARVTDRGGLPVCGWGAGKWLGKRGELLSEFIRSPAGADLYLGDSGGRPSIWPASKLLQQAGDTKRVLSGSDSLPLDGEEKRVGSFGGYLTGSCSQTSPASSLKDALSAENVTILPFGRSLNSFLFIKNQLALRLQG